MPHRVCPWWLGYMLASPLRRLMHDPSRILEPYVRHGMTVLEPGPGMGFFTLPMARLVGPAGRVVAVDVQPRMLAGLSRRAAKAGLSDRIETRVVPPKSLGLEGLTVDFVLAFAVVHEMPSAGEFFRQAVSAMKPEAVMLFAEPAGIKRQLFDSELADASAAGLRVSARPEIRRSQTAVLVRAL